MLIEKQCLFCKGITKLDIPDAEWIEYTEGIKLIQDAMPSVKPEFRELFLSRMCPKCWDETFKESEDED